LILGFIVTPLLLKYLGKEDLALFKIANDWLNSIGIFEQTLTGAMLIILSKSKNINSNTINATFLRYFKLSFIFIFIAIVATYFLPSLFLIPENKLSIVRMGFIIGSFSFLCLPFGVFRISIEHQEKSYLLSFWRTVQNIFQGSLLVLLAYFGTGIIGQFIGTILSNFFFALATYFIFKKISKDHVDFTSANQEQEHDQHFNKSNLDSFTLSIASKISFYSDTLVIGYFLTPAAILPFTLTQRLIQLIQENLQSIGTTSWASLNQLYIEKKMDQFQYYLETLSKITVYISLSLLIPLLILNQSFIELWIGTEFFAGFHLTFLAILNTSLMGLFSLWGWCLSGTGFIKEQVPIYIFNGIINLLFSIILTYFLGVSGPLIGTLVGFLLVYSWMIPTKLKKLLNVNPLPLIKLVVIDVFILAFTYFLFWKLNINLRITSFLNLAVYYSTFSLILFFFLQFIILDSNDRKVFYNIFILKIKNKFHPKI